MNNNERIGVSQVQLIVNQKMNWIFRELTIQDYGVDGHIEIMGNEYALGKLIGVQIKCGESYFGELKDENVIFRFDEKHFLYWMNYSVPVIIVLVNPKTSEVIWEVIDESNSKNVSQNNYKIAINRKNKFDESAIERLIQIANGNNLTFYNKTKISDEEKGDYFVLGNKYEFGDENYDIDYTKARYYYKLAADNGDRSAQFNYALLLFHGKGGCVDYSQAYLYMKKSALQNLAQAQYNLGLMFFHGTILYKRNILESKKWLSKAKENGHENAQWWLMYCDLFEIIYKIKTPSKRVDTIPFIDSFESLIRKITVRDLKLIFGGEIEQSKIVSWKKGLFFIANQAMLNALKYQDKESLKFWEDFQKVILLFELIGRYYNYDFESFIINITYDQLKKAWADQMKDRKIDEWNESIFIIASNEITNENDSEFWMHLIKCSDLLRTIEKTKYGKKDNNKYICVEIQKNSCSKLKICIKNISFNINENNDIRIQGNVEAMEDYSYLRNLYIKADLCDASGNTLYTLKDFSGIQLYISGFDSFSLYCCEIQRFLDLGSFSKIRIYPVTE